jgi:hypothetical protein
VLSEQVFEFAALVRAAIHSVGEDFEGVLSDLETRHRGRNTHLVQIWLKLTDPAVGWAVELLRRKGYFFCGVMPRWFEDGDGLLMEKAFSRPHWEGIELYSDRAKRLLEHIRADWEETGRSPDSPASPEGEATQRMFYDTIADEGTGGKANV